jgi:apolipoprotein N-acyltransferase
MRAKNFKNFISVFRLPILAGFLIGTSYIPFPPWALFICLSPLFVFWRTTDTARQAFWGGWLTQAILNMIGFHWIAYTAVEFGHFPWWLGGIVLLAFCALAHLHYPIAGWVSWHVRKRFGLSDGPAFLAMVLIFGLCEIAWPMIFPWHLGYPWLWANLPGAQFADVIGFEGLNTITVLINAGIAWAFFEWRRTRQTRRPLTIIAASVALLMAVNIAGLGRANPWTKGDTEAKFLIVQGNIGNFDKLIAERGREFRDPIIHKFTDLTRQGLSHFPQTDVVIWPETAFPGILDPSQQNDPHAQSVLMATRTNATPLLTGSYSYDDRTEDTYNGFFFIDKNGQTPVPPYRKSRLLVFGETFPFSEYIPYMDKLFPGLGAFGHGQGPTVMPITLKTGATVKLGPQICYEGLYPDFSAELAREGTQIFSNVTNDSWFGKEFEPRQHLIMTAARSIEFRRPLVRSTNTGITTAILATGEILEQSPLLTEWYGLYRVPYLNNPPHTPYEKIVGLRGWVLAFALLLLLGSAAYEQRFARKNPSPSV